MENEMKIVQDNWTDEHLKNFEIFPFQNCKEKSSK